MIARLARNKYGAVRTTVDGIRFDSKREAREWQVLKLRERAGEIEQLERQIPYAITINDAPVKIRSQGYPNGRAVHYIADFRYFDKLRGETVVIDIKGGIITDVAKLKMALVEAIHGVRVEVVR